MKQQFIKGFVAAGLALIALPVFAQDKKSDKKEKDHQTITITREADNDEKTTIEINGDKVMINGKNVKDIDDVQVNIHRMKNGGHGLSLWGTANGQNNFNFNTDGFSPFKEDSNRAMLGIVTDVDDKGAEITTVSKESPAEKAGLKKGDIITKMGDKKIEDADDIATAVRSHKPGDKVAITFLRDGKQQTATAELTRWKGIKMSTYAPGCAYENYNDAYDKLSMTIPRPPSIKGFMDFDFNRPKLGLSIQDTDDGKGVKVLKVDGDGNVAKAGIKEDDIITHVNETAVNSADEISKLMREAKDKVSVKMQLSRSGKSQTIEVRIPRKLKTADL